MEPASRRTCRRWQALAVFLFLAWSGLPWLAAARAEVVVPAIPARSEGDFAPDAVYPATTWSDPAPHPRVWGSWAGGDEKTGRLVLGPFPAPRTFRVSLAGYPTRAGNATVLRRVADGAARPLIGFDPHEHWTEIVVQPPSDWVGQPVEIEAVDGSTGAGGWLGISEPFDRDGRGALTAPGGAASSWLPPGARRLAAVLGALALNALLLALPGVALLPVLRRRVLLADSYAPLAAFSLTCLAAYAAFWLHWFNPAVGKAASLGITVISLAACARRGRRGLGAALGGAEARWAGTLAALAAGLYLGLLLLPQSGAGELAELATRRFLPFALPFDNSLPGMFAEKLARGEDTRVLAGDWLGSDRPPLQTGWLLLVREVPLALGLGRDAVDQTGGVLFQLGWVLAAWAFVRAAGFGRAAAVSIVAALVPTGFFYVNSLYVWPKLGAAALAGGAFTLLLQDRAADASRPAAARVAWAAVTAALGYLAHGAVLFSLAAVAGLLLLPRFSLGWRRTVLGVAVFAALCVPWSAYQKLYNPPGDRLIKWHLAGVLEIDGRTAWQATRDAYASAPAGRIAAQKTRNLLSLFRGDYLAMLNPAPAGAEERRTQEFFQVFRTLGVWNLGWFVGLALLLLRRGRGAPWPPGTRDGLLAAAAGAGGLLVWGLLFFNPPGFHSLDVHYGPYLTLLQFFPLLALILFAASRWLFAAVAVYHLALFAGTYPVLPAALRGPVDGLAAALAGASGLGLVIASVRAWRGESR